MVVFTLSVSCLPRALGIPWQWNSVIPWVPRRVPGIQCLCGCWLLTTSYFRNIVPLLILHLFILFRSFKLEVITILHLNQEGKIPILSLLRALSLSSLLPPTIGVVVYVFVSLSALWALGGEEWCLILYPFSAQHIEPDTNKKGIH